MAGEWIKMRRDLQRHPKVVRMASALRADRFRVIGGLHAVWSVFDEHSEDGCLDGYTFAAMDDAIGWQGFAEAMSSIGWLSFQEQQGLSVPEFDEHNGQSGKRRASETKRKRLERAGASGPQDDRDGSASDADKNRDQKKKKNSSSLRSEEESRKRSIAIQRPEEVTEQTWSDWQQLRKSKKAPVTETVLSGARQQAALAGMPLEQFLQVWCRRGSQGLEAAWLKPEERATRSPHAGSNKHSAAARAIWGDDSEQEIIDAQTH